jgi:hypothetical protein
MIPRFEDSGLLGHPTVEKAYGFFAASWADRESAHASCARGLRLAAYVSRHAASPDPDAVAALLVEHMAQWMKPEEISQALGPRAGELAGLVGGMIYEYGIGASPKSRGAAQMALAVMIDQQEKLVRILDDAEERDPETGNHCSLREIMNLLDAGDLCLQHAAPVAGPCALADMARAAQAAAQDAFAARKAENRAKQAFALTALPDHPLVRGAYAYMLEKRLSVNPLHGGAQDARDLADALFSTGATQDPDVLAAAMLNQCGFSKAGGDEEGEDNSALIRARFGDRVQQIWSATSPWADPRGSAAGIGEECRLIFAASQLLFTEYLCASLREGRGGDSWRFDELEQLETRCKKLAEIKTRYALPSGLEKRIARTLASAEVWMQAPQNLRVRKPGAPPRDRSNDW